MTESLTQRRRLISVEFVTGTTHRAGDSLEHSMKQGLVRFAGMLLTSAYNRYVLFNPFNVVEHCLSLLLCDFNALFEFNCCLHYKQSLFLLVKKKEKAIERKTRPGNGRPRYTSDLKFSRGHFFS